MINISHYEVWWERKAKIIRQTVALSSSPSLDLRWTTLHYLRDVDTHDSRHRHHVFVSSAAEIDQDVLVFS